MFFLDTEKAITSHCISLIFSLRPAPSKNMQGLSKSGETIRCACSSHWGVFSDYLLQGRRIEGGPGKTQLLAVTRLLGC